MAVRSAVWSSQYRSPRKTSRYKASQSAGFRPVAQAGLGSYGSGFSPVQQSSQPAGSVPLQGGQGKPSVTPSGQVLGGGQEQLGASGTYTPPTAPPGTAFPNTYPSTAPGGGSWDSYTAPAGYTGPGSFNVSPGVADPKNPGFDTSGLNSQIAAQNYNPAGAPQTPGFAPDGRPWWMVAQNAAANAADPNYVPMNQSTPQWMQQGYQTPQQGQEAWMPAATAYQTAQAAPSQQNWQNAATLYWRAMGAKI